MTGKAHDLHELNQEIKKCWDANVLTRALDLEQATDSSYINLIQPWVMEKVLCNTSESSSILDIGCGCGYLTNSVYTQGLHGVKGIDISESSIAYARKKYPSIIFECQDIYTLTTTQKYELCLAVMVLNNVPDMETFFSAVHDLLLPDGKVIVVIPHPCFWPQRHLTGVNYSYSVEIPYNFPFATQGRSDYASHILYFHRTLETYLRCIQKSGFQITDFQELVDTKGKREPDILCMELTLPK